MARPKTPTDADLISRSAAGDESAFAELYDRYATRVMGLAVKIVRDRAQAEEVAQEAFVEAWRTAARFDPARGDVASWLLTISHRRSVDRVRSEQASRNREEHDGASNPGTPPDPVTEQVELELDQERVRAALDHLTDLQREAIELAYYGGRTYREVAEMLDTPLGTVKSRLRDGLLRLREVMEVSG